MLLRATRTGYKRLTLLILTRIAKKLPRIANSVIRGITAEAARLEVAARGKAILP